jgi:ankyrin repeat protein
MAVCCTKNSDFEYKALYEYIEVGDEDNLTNFLNQFTDDDKISILTKTLNGYNCFHLCCNYGNIKCIKERRKYFIDLQTKDGDTCLLIC